MELSVIKIGNSKGFRLSKTLIEKYNIKDKIELILEKGYIILKPISSPRKGWDKAFKEMSEQGDDKLLFNDVFDDEKSRRMDLKQYQIVLVNLDPTMGSEIKKTRPCVIISPDEMNKHLRTIIIAPMTTTSKKYPTRIEVKHDNKTGWIVIDQIRTIDKLRVTKIFGSMSLLEIKKVKSVLKETFVD